MMTLKDKSVLVMGLGETGLSMLRWLNAQGARLRAADSRSAPPGLAEAKQYLAETQIYCGAFSDELFDGIELIAISPGVPLRDPAVARAIARGIIAVGDIELFAQSLKNDHRPRILAITGSNGKTTVTSMVEHLCKAAGKDVVAAGNISPAVLDVVLERGEEQPVQLPAGDHIQFECRCGDRAECQRGSSRPLCRHHPIQRRQGAHICGVWRAGAEPGRCALYGHGARGMQNHHIRLERAGLGG
jgi:hypothetical protein